MTQLPAIAIVGASGRMGQMLIKTVLDSDICVLAGVTERAGHDWVGKDLGACMEGSEIGIMVSDYPLEVFVNKSLSNAPCFNIPPNIFTSFDSYQGS